MVDKTPFFPLAKVQMRHLESKCPARDNSKQALSWEDVLNSYSPWEQKIICLLLANNYKDAIMYLNSDSSLKTSKYYERIKMLLRIYILNSEYDAVLELESRLSNCQFDSLDFDEKMNFIECKSLILLNCYLKAEFYLCVQKFVQLLVEIPSFIKLLRNLSKEGAFITDTMISNIVVITVLITIPLDNIRNFIQLQELHSYNLAFSTMAEKSKLLIDSKFGQFFEWWHNDMDTISTSDYFLSKKWDLAARTMRQKIYSFYLRISLNITVGYLSEKFNIDYQLVREELLSLIENAHLNFEVRDDVVLYKEFDAWGSLKNEVVAKQQLISSRLANLDFQNRKLADIIKKRVKDSKPRIPSSSQISIGMDEIIFSTDDDITDD